MVLESSIQKAYIKATLVEGRLYFYPQLNSFTGTTGGVDSGYISSIPKDSLIKMRVHSTTQYLGTIISNTKLSGVVGSCLLHKNTTISGMIFVTIVFPLGRQYINTIPIHSASQPRLVYSNSASIDSKSQPALPYTKKTPCVLKCVNNTNIRYNQSGGPILSRVGGSGGFGSGGGTGETGSGGSLDGGTSNAIIPEELVPQDNNVMLAVFIMGRTGKHMEFY